MDTIFTVRIDSHNPQHTIISIFNRGGLAGQLTILTEDLNELIKRITGGLSISQQVETIESGAKVVGVKIDRLG